MNPAHKIIKNCPHCGGTACICSKYSNKSRSYFVFVRCDICGAQGKTYSSEEEPAAQGWCVPASRDAVIAWNMRHSETRQEEKEK